MANETKLTRETVLGRSVLIRTQRAQGGGHDWEYLLDGAPLGMGWSAGTRREAIGSALYAATERLSRDVREGKAVQS